MFYEMLRPIFTFFFRAFYSVKIIGSEYLPEEGPVILCANHSSYFDSMLVGLCTKRKVRFIVYDRFYYHWFWGPFIRFLKSIPIADHGINKDATKKALEVLKGGGVIGIFPEGRLTTTGLTGPAERGAAMLAAFSGAPIVPITIMGAYPVYPKGRKLPRLSGKITVKVHPLIAVDSARRKEEGYLRGITDNVMETIKGGLAS